jgi:hypothetical protein
LQASSRVLDCSAYFEPSAGVKQDHDSTNFEYDLTTRDYTPDRLNINALVRKLRLRYELIDAGTDDPTLNAWYSLGAATSTGAVWGTSLWGTGVWGGADTATEAQLAGVAPEDDGRHPYNWSVNKRGALHPLPLPVVGARRQAGHPQPRTVHARLREALNMGLISRLYNFVSGTVIDSEQVDAELNQIHRGAERGHRLGQRHRRVARTGRSRDRDQEQLPEARHCR